MAIVSTQGWPSILLRALLFCAFLAVLLILSTLVLTGLMLFFVGPAQHAWGFGLVLSSGLAGFVPFHPTLGFLNRGRIGLPERALLLAVFSVYVAVTTVVVSSVDDGALVYLGPLIFFMVLVISLIANFSRLRRG